jgi:hypothetical protein
MSHSSPTETDEDLSNGGGGGSTQVVPAHPGMNPAAATADGGVGMTTGSVKSLQNVRGDGGSLLACGRETIRRVKMGSLLSKSSIF